MSNEITKLKQKLMELEFKLNVKTLDLKKCQANLAEYKAKLAEQKAAHKIQTLDSKEKVSTGIDIDPALKDAHKRLNNMGTGEDKKP